jgi:hypothetical protein
MEHVKYYTVAVIDDVTQNAWKDRKVGDTVRLGDSVTHGVITKIYRGTPEFDTYVEYQSKITQKVMEDIFIHGEEAIFTHGDKHTEPAWESAEPDYYTKLRDSLVLRWLESPCTVSEAVQRATTLVKQMKETKV